MTDHWKTREKNLIAALQKISNMDSGSAFIAKKALLHNDGWKQHSPSEIFEMDFENVDVCTIDRIEVEKLENFRGRLWHATLENNQVVQLDEYSSFLYAKPK